MIKTIFLGIFCAAVMASSAQVINDVNGKTYYYYDTLSHKKVKEIFHHKQVVMIMSDPKNPGEFMDTFLYVKNGPYTRYSEAGPLDCSGYYRDEKKDSTWKFYNLKGDLIRTEKWRKGTRIQ